MKKYLILSLTGLSLIGSVYGSFRSGWEDMLNTVKEENNKQAFVWKKFKEYYAKHEGGVSMEESSRVNIKFEKEYEESKAKK